MAIAFSYGSRIITNFRLGWWSNSITGEVRQGISTSPPSRSPGWTFSLTKPAIQSKPVAIVPLQPPIVSAPKPIATISIAPPIRTEIYTPIAETAPAPAPAPAPSAAIAAPAPVTVTTGTETKPCSNCGGKVTDAPTAAPVAAAPAPALSASVEAAPAAPAPASPAATDTPKAPAKPSRLWPLAFALLGVIVAGLALAAAVRPRK